MRKLMLAMVACLGAATQAFAQGQTPVPSGASLGVGTLTLSGAGTPLTLSAANSCVSIGSETVCETGGNALTATVGAGGLNVSPNTVGYSLGNQSMLSTGASTNSSLFLRSPFNAAAGPVLVVYPGVAATSGDYLQLFSDPARTTKIFSVDFAGNTLLGSGANLSLTGVIGTAASGRPAGISFNGASTSVVANAANATFWFTAATGDASNAIGFALNNTVSLVTVGAKLLSVQNAGVEKAYVDKDGNIIRASHITCTMAAGTTCAATVPAGSACMCQATSGTASAVSCAVAATTATCTASAANSATWNVLPY